MHLWQFFLVSTGNFCRLLLLPLRYNYTNIAIQHTCHFKNVTWECPHVFTHSVSFPYDIGPFQLSRGAEAEEDKLIWIVNVWRCWPHWVAWHRALFSRLKCSMWIRPILIGIMAANLEQCVSSAVEEEGLGNLLKLTDYGWKNKYSLNAIRFYIAY